MWPDESLSFEEKETLGRGRFQLRANWETSDRHIMLLPTGSGEIWFTHFHCDRWIVQSPSKVFFFKERPLLPKLLLWPLFQIDICKIFSLEYEYVDMHYLRRKKVPVLWGQYWCYGAVILGFMEALLIEYYAVSVFVHSYLLITERCNFVVRLF